MKEGKKRRIASFVMHHSGCVAYDIKLIYREVNNASFVAHHSSGSFWNDVSFLPISFRDILFSDF